MPVRYRMLGLIAVLTTLNYLDRTLLSIAAPAMTADLGLDPATLGVVFSVFSWSYAIAQVPGGIVLDRLGVRTTYFLSVTLWSLFTALQGAAFGLWSLLVTRLCLGAAEAPCFPANSRVLVSWFPQRERARANSVYAVGQYVGIAFMSPLLFWTVATFGWRALFFIVGGIGVVLGFVWLRLYRDPSRHPSVTQAELDLIAADGGVVSSGASLPFSWRNVRWLITRRQVFGASLGQFATNSTLIFFLTWFPTYLAVERKMSWISVGFYATLPFIAASIGVLAGGQISDWLVRRTASLSIGRKFPVVAGLMLSSTIILAAGLDSNALVIAVLSIAFFGQGMANLGWTLISEVAPASLVGLTGGVFNFCTQLAGIITPIVIGLIVQQTGSFHGALAFIGCVALVGALSYIVIVGKVERIAPPVWTH
ncbi:MFS transporter [Sphingobium algorifonticola]|nr:MFS transporter [Sphingobium algorifonticola]